MVRNATSADLDALVHIVAYVQGLHHHAYAGHFCPPDRSGLRRFFSKQLEDNDCRLLVYEDPSNSVVGYRTTMLTMGQPRQRR